MTTQRLQESGSAIAVGELIDSAVNLVIRIGASEADYWGVYFNTLENTTNTLGADEIDISIPCY